MGRRVKRRRLGVWMNGELAGEWHIPASGHHEFHYAATWLDLPQTRPLSLSMPLRPPRVPYRGAVVEAFFDNQLPDSADIRRRIQARFGTASTEPFDLLSEIGRDCVGAVQLLATDAEAPDIRRIEGEPLQETDVAAVLRATVAAPALGQRGGDEFRISIAGAQEKTALLWHEDCWQRPRGATPSTHIFKLPLGRIGREQIDLTTSIDNEWLCAQVVAAYGLPAARCQRAQFEDQRVLIVERFDRSLVPDGSWWMRLPQEDLCQSTGTPPGLKYENDGGPGISAIMSLLLGAHEARADRARFFKTQLVFWLLAAIDGHAKNFSVFIDAGGRYALTPLYDVMSAYPVMGHGAHQLAPEKVRMAMAVSGKNRHYEWQRILRRHWLATAHACNFRNDAERLLIEVVERTPGVIAAVGRLIPNDFPAAVAEPILSGIRAAAERLGRMTE